MLVRAARLAYDELAAAPRTIAVLIIPMAVAWYIGRHALFWFLATGFTLFDASGHLMRTHHESQIARGEVWLAWLAADAIGAFVFEARAIHLVGAMLGLIGGGRTQTTLLGLIAFPGANLLLGLLALALYPIALLLFPVFAVYLILGCVLSLIGVRAALARYLRSRGADVVDIHTGLPVQA